MSHNILQEDVVRKALPDPVIPAWLNPHTVDVDKPLKLPLCWYGLPFFSNLVFAYAKRIGIAEYLSEDTFQSKAGTLDIYQTWANLDLWFRRKSGLRMQFKLVWGRSRMILTFFSNHEIPRMTDEMWGQICDLLDDIGYPWECQTQWYLDRGYRVRVYTARLAEQAC